jgi:hypothetical protein
MARFTAELDQKIQKPPCVLFFFSSRRHLVILPFVSVSLITQLVWEMSRFANQTAVST